MKGLDDYGTNFEESDGIWLRGVLQAVIYGIDSKADVIFIQQEALLIFITMHQGQSDNNNGYLKRFKYSVITLKLAGGEHHLYHGKVCQKGMNIGDVTPGKDEKENISSDTWQCIVSE